MAKPSTIHIRRDSAQWCESMIERGRFSTFSELLDYSMRFYADHIERDGIRSIPKIVRNDLVRRTFRFDDSVLERLMATGFFERSEIADYSLNFYRQWLGEND